MHGTILEHYYSRDNTFVSISDFSAAVCKLLNTTIDPNNKVSIKTFFEAYDTRRITDLEYDVAMRNVSMRHGKPSTDPLQPFRPEQ